MNGPGGMNLRFAIVAVLFLLATAYLYTHKDMLVPTNRPLSSFPVQVGTWKMSGESFMTDQVLDKLRPTDYLSRAYANETGDRLTLYIGYHGGGKDAGEIHSPKHCLPGSGWNEAHTRKSQLSTGSDVIHLVSSVYQKGQQKELFLYWFQVKGKTLDNEYYLKLAGITNSMLYKRRDAAFIRISVPFEADEQKAISNGEAFVRDLYPIVKAYLPS